MRDWRNDWAKRHKEQKSAKFPLPEGRMEPIGYVLIQHRYTKAYTKWANRIPTEYREHVNMDDQPCLAQIRHYLSLMPMAQEARKPIFHLTPADGAIGSHFQAARAAGGEFAALALSIRKRIGL